MTMRQAIHRATAARGAYIYLSRKAGAWRVVARDTVMLFSRDDIAKLGVLYVSACGRVEKA